MKLEKCIKESFVVIGNEGSTNDGTGFIEELWKNANSHFNEVAHIAKKDDKGNLLGIWGAMSDFSHSFIPWQNGFSQGLYLAGVECKDDAETPKGWTKWIIPSYEYLYVENEGNDTFSTVMKYFQENTISLAGAVHDFTCQKTGKRYTFFPIRRLQHFTWHLSFNKGAFVGAVWVRCIKAFEHIDDATLEFVYLHILSIEVNVLGPYLYKKCLLICNYVAISRPLFQCKKITLL